MARLFVTLPEDLHDRLRIESIHTKKKHGELVVTALEKLMDFESKDKYTMHQEDDVEEELTHNPNEGTVVEDGRTE